MARFRGTVQGGRSEASRLGHATTGLSLRAAGWSGAIRVLLTAGEGDDNRCFVAHDAGGTTTVLYAGSLDRHDDPRGNEIKLYEEDESNG